MPDVIGRNGIKWTHLSYAKNAADMDHVFDLADAELNSDKGTHAIAERLRATHKEWRKTFAREVGGKVAEIARREGYFYFARGNWPTQQVALAIAELWFKQSQEEA